ncbi:hypothetical protein PMAYCL1PPCAC_27098, partial [Pristionchus mayeri]
AVPSSIFHSPRLTAFGLRLEHLFIGVLLTIANGGLTADFPSSSLGATNEMTLLRVMTFNVWQSGTNVINGVSKIAAQIRTVNPDVVTFQEMFVKERFENIGTILGTEWSGVIHCHHDTAILTRHTIVPGSYAQFDRGMHVRIRIEGSGREVSVWTIHLHYQSYGPYAAQNKLVTNEDQILAGEMPTNSPGRVHGMVQLLLNPSFRSQIAQSDTVPVIVTGDFNSPSDEDWIDENRDKHGGWAIKWPTTQLLRDTAGMKDSFRELFPSPVTHPGTTWSVFKYLTEWDYTVPEPEDRIDFIFYRGSIRPFASEIFAGSSELRPQPHHYMNDWPSDHFVVVTDFVVIPSTDAVFEPMKELDPKFVTKHSEIRSKMCEPPIYRASDKVKQDVEETTNSPK